MSGWAMLFICLGVGYLAYRGSGKLFNAILAGVAFPFGAFVIFGTIIGRAELESLGPGWIVLGIAFILGVWLLIQRGR